MLSLQKPVLLLYVQQALPVDLYPGSSKGYLEYIEEEVGELT